MHRGVPVLRRCSLVIAAVIAMASVAVRSDEPSADYIFPAGGQRGTTVEFRVGAHFLHGGSPFEMSGDGVAAGNRIERVETTWFEGPMIFKPQSQRKEDYPKDHRGTVTIAADARPGIRYWRLWTSQGAAAGRPFVIGDLPEVVENEIDGRPVPEKVKLPVTINGRIFPREDVDIWEFHAEAGQSVTCEVLAARMGSPLDSRLEVRGPDDQVLAQNYDHFGTDSFVRFQARRTGIHSVRIHDSTLRGLQSFVYRLTLTAGSHVDRVFPLGGKAGEFTAFRLAGQDVPDEPVQLQLPENTGGAQLEYFPLGGRLSNPVLLDVSHLDEYVEPVQDDAPAQLLQLPAVLNGQIMHPGEKDRWTVDGKKGERFRFQVLSSSLGSPLDAVLHLTDAEGKTLKSSASTPQKPLEPAFDFEFPVEGLYELTIEDCFPDRGGSEFAYRLKVERPASPDFRLNLPADVLTATRGVDAKLKIGIERRNGFGQEVKLSAAGLPDGVTAPDVTIPADKKDAELIFTTAKNARIAAHHIAISGTATIDGKVVTRMATLSGSNAAPDRDDVLLAVAMPTPFKLSGVSFQTSYAARGTTHRRRFVIDWGDYQGSLNLSLADRQIRHLQGVRSDPMTVANGTPEVFYPIQIPTWLEMNRTGRMVVMAVGEVRDEDGNVHKVSFSSGAVNDQIIILTAPCPMSVSVHPESVRAVSGRSADVRVSISRGVLPRQPVRVELQLPRHFVGVAASAVEIPADQDTGQLRVEFSGEPGPFNMPAVIRARTVVDGDPVIAETHIELVSEPSVAGTVTVSER